MGNVVDLFSPYELGPITLKNRMVMAPLTRNRAQPNNVPGASAARYYSERAGAGLIVTEATQISAGAQGYVFTPGIHSDEQIEGWKKVTAAVHEKGGRIFLQLWHVGRISHPDFNNGALPVAPSAIAPRNMTAHTFSGPKAIPAPRPLELDEIPQIVEDFRQAAENAKAAGFDGVEVHGANGYLLDQFLEDSTNQRNDAYGGSVANRARLLLEVTEAVTGVWGIERVGVRLSPGGTFNDMGDSNPKETFSYAIRALSGMHLAYLHLIEPRAGHGQDTSLNATLFRPLFSGTLIAANDYTLERAQKTLAEGSADLIAFGRLFLANPDLVQRFRLGAPLNAPNPETFYSQGDAGYIDYPPLPQHYADSTQNVGV